MPTMRPPGGSSSQSRRNQSTSPPHPPPGQGQGMTTRSRASQGQKQQGRREEDSSSSTIGLDSTLSTTLTPERGGEGGGGVEPQSEVDNDVLHRFDKIYTALIALTNICTEHVTPALPLLRHIFKVVERNHARHIFQIPYEVSRQQKQVMIKKERVSRRLQGEEEGGGGGDYPCWRHEQEEEEEEDMEEGEDPLGSVPNQVSSPSLVDPGQGQGADEDEDEIVDVVNVDDDVEDNPPSLPGLPYLQQLAGGGHLAGPPVLFQMPVGGGGGDYILSSPPPPPYSPPSLGMGLVQRMPPVVTLAGTTRMPTTLPFPSTMDSTPMTIPTLSTVVPSAPGPGLVATEPPPRDGRMEEDQGMEINLDGVLFRFNIHAIHA